MTDAQATTLAGREEVIGRNYPVILERLLLLMVVIVFILGYGEVSDWSGEGFVAVSYTHLTLPTNA